jgi:hypothetical protein
VDPIDLKLVKEILAEVTTPDVVKKTFDKELLFKKIYELPSEKRLEFLKVRLLLNLLKLQARNAEKESGKRSVSILPASPRSAATTVIDLSPNPEESEETPRSSDTSDIEDMSDSDLGESLLRLLGSTSE